MTSPSTPSTGIVAFIEARLEERIRARDHWIACEAPNGGRCSCTGSLGERNRYVLADIAAKRAILREHEIRELEGESGCPLCNYDDEHGWSGRPGACRTVRLLAAPFASHPDMRDEWRVEEDR